MIEIKDLLLRFSNILLSEEIKIEAIKNVLYKITGLEIKNKDIKIKNNAVYLNIKPIYKNEIFLQKEKITSLLGEALGKKTSYDIR